MANGTYDVSLKFIETWWSAPGQRISAMTRSISLSVTINRTRDGPFAPAMARSAPRRIFMAL